VDVHFEPSPRSGGAYEGYDVFVHPAVFPESLTQVMLAFRASVVKDDGGGLVICRKQKKAAEPLV